MLEKVELQKELADLKHQIQVIKFKNRKAAGIGNRNSNHKTNEEDLVEARHRQSLPSSLGNTANYGAKRSSFQMSAKKNIITCK